MRITLDTNVIVSGLLSAHGPPGKLLDAWLARRFVLVTSLYQLDEMQRVAQYPRLRERIPAELLHNVISWTREFAFVASGDLPDIDASPDPPDNPIIATAVAGGADLLVSGDHAHLVNLPSIRGIRIVTPHDASEMLKL